MNIYVASSWRNDRQPAVVAYLRDLGHEVYDFKNPPNGAGFGWEEVGNYDGDGLVDPVEFVEMLEHPRAVEGFRSDFDAMRAADVCVLVLPCNRSAHLELGWFVGAGRRTVVLLEPDQATPELMYKMVDAIVHDMAGLELALTLGAARPGGTPRSPAVAGTVADLDECVAAALNYDVEHYGEVSEATRRLERLVDQLRAGDVRFTYGGQS